MNSYDGFQRDQFDFAFRAGCTLGAASGFVTGVIFSILTWFLFFRC